MTAKKLTVGAHLEAWCTKCKEDRDHVVETVKSDGAANKVRCGFCDGSHLYRAPKGAAAPAKAAKAAGAKGESKPKSGKSKDGQVTEAEQAKAKPYAMDREFAVGDVISHAKFGFGRVTALKAGGKMEVSFGGGARLLVCKDIGSLLLKRSRGAIRVVQEVALVEEEEEAAEIEPAPIEDEVDSAAAEEEE